MDRQEALARVEELQKNINASIAEAEELCVEHELSFTISSPWLNRHSEGNIRFYSESEREEYDDGEFDEWTTTRYTGGWNSSWC